MGSRGAGSDDKYNSIALGVVYANLRQAANAQPGGSAV